MMAEINKYLSDKIIAINLIEDFTAEIDDFLTYQKDFKIQSAVERQLIIIGEALNKIKKKNPNFKIENSNEIIGFRNRLTHAYDNIDNSIVGAILKLHLNQLKQEINTHN